MSSVVKSLSKCAVCESSQIEEAIHLPELPLSGTYAPKDRPKDFQGYDLTLMLCESCKHLQLADQLDPSTMYTAEDYHFRGGMSAKCNERLDCLLAFIKSSTKDRKFKTILDVGCNDLFFLNNLKDFADKLVGADPILKDRDGEVSPEGIHLIGKAVEELKVEDLPKKADLVLCIHTLEHLSDPKVALRNMLEVASDDAFFLIEIPNFEVLQNRKRFDQLFHQHLHYFTESSLTKLIESAGCKVVSKMQSDIHWGSLLFMFSKKGMITEKLSPLINPEAISKERIAEDYNCFKEKHNGVGEYLNQQENLYGYGAALLLPVMAYHWKSDLSGLKCIYDDDPGKEGLSYSNLNIEIKTPTQNSFNKEASFFVTAVDNFSSISRNLKSKPLKKIINPLDIA